MIAPLRNSRRWLRKRVARFAELHTTERLLLARAILATSLVRLALWTAPLQACERCAGWAAIGLGPHPVDRLVWAITAASRYVPGASCLTQALTAGAFLRRSGHDARVEIGVAKERGQKETSRFEAHAWLVSGGRIVLGAKDAARYQPILALER